MPVITDIQRQKRSDDRFSVYIDGVYAFALSDLALSNSGLRVGRELTPEEVRGYVDQATNSKSYNLALRYIGIRPRSAGEMRDYLYRKGYEPIDTEHIIDQLKDIGMIDDQSFASSWIISRQIARPRSIKRLEQELMAKHVSREDIASALSGLDQDTELEALIQLVERLRTRSMYQDKTKLTQYLLRQGYNFSQIKKALERPDELD